MELFITYAHEDVAKVRELAELLTAGGHAVWFDSQLLPGQDWKLELNTAIARCDAYVYALTKGAVTSEWCKWEFATAVRLRKPVLPILFEADLAIPQQLQKLQYADFQHGATAIATAKLFAAFASMQKIPVDQSLPIPADPKGIPSRAWEDNKHWTDAIVTPIHQPRDDAEEIQAKFSAKCGVVGGRITITNQRLLWEPSKLNFRGLFGFGIRPEWWIAQVDIPLRDVRDIEPGLGTNGDNFTVHCRSGLSHTFHVVAWFRARIIALIEQQRSLAKG